MKHRNRRWTAIAITSILLVASISYVMLGDRDGYQYFTGPGSNLAVSHDDQRLAFSFYEDGTEAIYTSELDGNDVKKITHPNQERHRKPAFSSDGSMLLYLSQDPDGIQSLYTANMDGTNPQKISGKDQHVLEAIFSKDSKSVFFTSMPAEDFHKAEGEAQEGIDLYSVNSDGTDLKQLTDKDRLSMESLALSSDGKEIYYKDFTDLYVFNLEKGLESMAAFSKNMPAEPFHLTFSADGKSVAYTEVSKESMNSSLYEYELFMKDLVSSEAKRLTNLKTAVVSPVFFNKENKIIFYEHINWPNDPEKYKLMTVNIETEEVTEIHLDLPAAKSDNLVMKTINSAVNSWTIAILYALLLILSTLQMAAEKIFLPTLISLGIALLAIAASFVVAAAVDPWAGIAIGMVAAGMLGCTIVSFLFALGMKLSRKRA
jgi:Tol biopolymer transport system component